MVTTSLQSLYQVKISLMDSKPPIWRRLLLHSDVKLSVFHTIIQHSMGWEDCHLHQFKKDGLVYGLDDDNIVENESKYKISDLLKKENDSLLYEYDFGDDWMHKITLEKRLPFESSAELVQCIKGKRSCPPEDCGGIWGYEYLLDVISDPSHEEHEERLDWLGGTFDPEHFSLSETNSLLSEYVK
jgi:hypothetical protein